MTVTLLGITGDNSGLTVDSEGHYNVRVSYSLESDTATEAPLIVFAAVPTVYPYGDALLFILQLDTAEVSRNPGSKYHWTANVNYSSRTPDPDKSGPAKSGYDNPLDEPPVIKWSSGTTTEIIEKDINGVAILNSAGEPFDPPVEIQVPQPKLTISRNEASFSGTDALDYVYTVNTASFAGGAAGTVLCVGINADDSYSNGVQYWKVTYEFLYRRQGWQKSLLNQSMMYKTGGNWKRITDDAGQFITDPVPIDELGQVIDRDNLPASASFLDFDVYEEKNFGDLNLPV